MRRTVSILLLVACAIYGCQKSSSLVGDTGLLDQMREPDSPTDTFPDTYTNPDWECVNDEECVDVDPCTRGVCDPSTHTCMHEPFTGLAFMGPDIQITDHPWYVDPGFVHWTGSSLEIAWADGREGECTEGFSPSICNKEIYRKSVNLAGEELGPETRISFDDDPCSVSDGELYDGKIGFTWHCGWWSIGSGHLSWHSLDETSVGTRVLTEPGFSLNRPYAQIEWTGSELMVGWNANPDDPDVPDPGPQVQRWSPIATPLADPIGIGNAEGRGGEFHMDWTGSELGVAMFQYDEELETGVTVFTLTSHGEFSSQLARTGSWNVYRPLLTWIGDRFMLLYQDIGYPPGDSFKTRLAIIETDGEMTDSEILDPDVWYDVPIWTGSEITIVWARRTGWEQESYLSRADPTGDFIDDPFPLPDTGRLAWTGSEYLLVWSDDLGGAWDLYINRIGFCP